MGWSTSLNVAVAPPVQAAGAVFTVIADPSESGLPQPAFGHESPPAAPPPRAPLPFRAVNAADQPGYDPQFQRHHLLPRQLLSARCFGALIAGIGRGRVGFDDFRSNGLLLPATDDAARRIGLPLHRGPHPDYTGLVAERVGQIEASWQRHRRSAPEAALDEAVMRLGVLQQALRRRLLAPRRAPLRLNRFDPGAAEPLAPDFTVIEALVADLWPATESSVTASLPPPAARVLALPTAPPAPEAISMLPAPAFGLPDRDGQAISRARAL